MIGKTMKERRVQLGKKPSDIARLIGVSESTYRDWENGRKIQGEPYQKLADALEINILELLGIKRAEQSYLKDELITIEGSVKNIRKIVM